jgi:hypothetical protein
MVEMLPLPKPPTSRIGEGDPDVRREGQGQI